MKKIILLTISVILAIATYAQVQQGFSYQAVIRNMEGQPVTDQLVGVRLTLQDEAGTTVYYTETHTVNTSPQGVVNLVVGSGNEPSGLFAEIPWGSGDIYLKTEIDQAGGTEYAELGTTKLYAVPFSLFAADGNQGPQGEPGIPGEPGVDGANGLSAYEVWLAAGNAGTEADYLASLKGEKGDQGDAGTPGTNGLDGRTVLNGTTDPTSGVGFDGDFYLNTLTSTLFGPKAGGAWPSGVLLIGEQGPEGPVVSGSTGQFLVRSGSSWVATSAIFLNSNQFGIGTTVPEAKLHVIGDIKSSGKI